MPESLEDRTQALKREALLARIGTISQYDVERWVPIGLVGQEMGLPYEEALALTDSLREAGLIRRGGGGPLDAPVGPRVHLLPAGVEHLRKMESATTDSGA